MLRHNKAQTQSVFVWLFAIIAGGAFLTLFFSISSSQQTMMETRSLETNADLLENMIQLLITTANAEQTVPAPPRPVHFTCLSGDSYINHEFYYQGATRDSPMPGLPVFTPPSLPTNQWKLRSTSISIGHPVGQAVYIIPVSYQVPVGSNTDTSILRLLNRTGFNTTFSNTAPQVTMQTVSNAPSDPVYYHGTVQYSDGSTVKWIGKEMLLGALISNSSSLYTCNRKKIENLLQASVQITVRRAQALTREIIGDNEDNCRTLYGGTVTALTELSESTSFSEDPEAYLNTVMTVERHRNRELRYESCPNLY